MSTKLLPWVELMKEDFDLVNRLKSGESVWWGVHHRKVNELRGLIRLMLGDAVDRSPPSVNRDNDGELYINDGAGQLLVLYRMTNPKASSHPWYVHLPRLSEASEKL